MSFWPCTVPECLKRSLFVNGDCRECGARLCRDHAGKEAFHPCEGMDMETRYLEGRPQADREMFDTIIAKFDIPTVIRQAQAFRQGHSCQILAKDLDRKNIEWHGTNVNFPLTFDDGHKWMVRVRQPGKGRPPYEAARMTSMSEAATFRAIFDGGVAVPQVWVPDLANEPDALIYYFVDFIEGGTYPPFLQTRHVLPTDLTVKAIYNVAQWFLSLERVHFDSVGSLYFDPGCPGKIIVGPVIDMSPQEGKPPFYRGPYKTAKARYVDFFDNAMEKILAGTRSLAEHDVDDYLTALEVKALVMSCPELEEGPWYIKHGEDKGDHILIREDGTVSGVIDWEWSCTSCKADAFIPPLTFNNGAYWTGSNAICPYEAALMDAYIGLGRPDLAEIVHKGKKFRRLKRFMIGEFPELPELRCLERAFKGSADQTEGQMETAADIRAALMAKHRADSGLQALIARERVD